jgi:uncharacterized membrane protein (DUF4010 family)
MRKRFDKKMKEAEKPLTKKKAIIIFLKITLFTIIFTVIAMKLMYEYLPVKPILLAFAIALPIMIISSIVGYKYRKGLEKKHGKKATKVALKSYTKFTKIMGVILIATSIPSIIINYKIFSSYINLIIGIVFIIFGIFYSKKHK